MNKFANGPENDPYLARLRNARDSGAVLKAKLAELRASLPGVKVFAFEGPDDKIVYYQWISRISPHLKYESFPCKGKRGVRELKAVLARDLGGLRDGVFFFVDRDFDDLRGFVNTEDVFMTDRYSVENYLVSSRVLEDLLRTEFPCHGRPAVRKTILDAFEEAYECFLRETAELNLRIFVARSLSIELLKALPTKAGKLMSVTIEGAVTVSRAEELVIYKDEPNSELVSELSSEFRDFMPAHRFRGKFALMFFQQWLTRLVEEFETSQKGWFADIDENTKPRATEFTLSNFASKSEYPAGLCDFLSSV